MGRKSITRRRTTRRMATALVSDDLRRREELLARAERLHASGLVLADVLAERGRLAEELTHTRGDLSHARNEIAGLGLMLDQSRRRELAVEAERDRIEAELVLCRAERDGEREWRLAAQERAVDAEKERDALRAASTQMAQELDRFRQWRAAARTLFGVEGG